jgi:polycystin 1L2
MPSNQVNKIVSSCTSEYSSFTQDQRSYDPKWQTNSNSSISSSLYNINILNAFKYTKSSDLNSYPFAGKVNTYLGGGYVFKMMSTSNHTKLENQAKTLQNLTWINEQTSAIFLEFTLFNPNVNLFQHCLFLFEITSGGHIVKSSQLTPLNLFDLNDKSLISFKIIMYLIYMILVCILIVTETRHLLKSKWTDYFRNAYNYFDLCIIGFSWAAFSMYLYRFYSAYEINDTLKRNDDKSQLFINFQYTASCQILFDFLMASCVFFASLRFIKIFRFNRRVIVFVHAFKKCLSELVSFGLILIIAWMSFVQAFYILLNTEAKEFASIFDSMATCFQIILGKFNSQAFVGSKSILPLPLFVAYNVAIVFVMVNLLVSILGESFELARQDNDLRRDDVDVIGFAINSILSLNPFVEKTSNTKNVYVDFFQNLETSVDKFIFKFKRVIQIL